MKFSVPGSVQTSKNKRFTLNINQYRNAHHFTLSKAKNEFNECIYALGLPKKQFNKIQVDYTVYAKTNRAYDLMNVISIVDKFLMDALIKIGMIEDDNISRVIFPTAKHGGVDKENPRIEVEIKEVD